jgi:hypothetical protein
MLPFFTTRASCTLGLFFEGVDLAQTFEIKLVLPDFLKIDEVLDLQRFGS